MPTRFPSYAAGGILLFALGFASIGAATAMEDHSETGPAVRNDRYGHPLPEGALARISALRQRHADAVTALAYAPDGKSYASASADHWVVIWNAATGHRIRQMRVPEYGTHQLYYSSNGDTLIAVSGHGHEEKSIRKWEVASGKTVFEKVFRDGERGMSAVCLSPDGKKLAYADAECAIRVLALDTGRELERRWDQPARARALHWSSDDDLLALGHYKDEAYLWNVRTCKIAHQSECKTEYREPRFAFSPDGRWFAVGDNAGLAIRETSTGKRWAINPDYFSSAFLLFAPKSNRWWYACVAGGVLLQTYFPSMHVCSFSIEGTSHVAAFSPDGTKLIIGGDRSPFRIQHWDLLTRSEISPDASEGRGVASIAFAPDGRELIATGGGWAMRDFHLWNSANGECSRSYYGHPDQVGCVALSPNGRMIASAGGSAERTVRLWDRETGEEINRLDGHGSAVTAVAFSPDGVTIASSEELHESPKGRHECRILLWNSDDGHRVGEIKGIGGAVHALSFSPDGRMLAVGADTLGLWSVQTQRRIGRFQHTGLKWENVRSVAFSPDGKLLAWADDRLCTWLGEVSTGRIVLRVAGGTGIAFSPDGRWLATGTTSGTVNLHDFLHGDQRAVWTGHESEIKCLAFSPDGRRLASGSADNTALIWDVETAIASAPKPATRNLGEKRLEALWNRLQSENANEGHWAAGELVLAADAVAFLESRLKPVAESDLNRISALIRELEHDRFAIRNQAAKELEKHGLHAEPALLAALNDRPTLDLASRLETLLRKLDDPSPDGEQLRAARAIRVLELIGSRDAQLVLQKLASGAAWAPETMDAKQALKRLSSEKPDRDATIPAATLLHQIARTYDCYFTIEGYGGPEAWSVDKLLNARLTPPDSKVDLDGALKSVSDQMKGVIFKRDADNKSIIHVIDAKVAKDRDYALEKKCSIKYSGLLNKLPGDMRKHGITNLGCQNILDAKELKVVDLRTKINIDEKNKGVRSILCDHVPLRGHGRRIMWLAETETKVTGLETELYYLAEGKLEPMGSIPPGIADFILGEDGYYHNLLCSPGKERDSCEKAAAKFIENAFAKREYLQVRWAMFFLGKIQSFEHIPLLLKHLDYQYTNHGIVEESYPAVRALTDMGGEATKPVLKALREEIGDLRAKLLCRVLFNLEGKPGAKKLLQAQLDQSPDKDEKTRLEKALKLIEAEM